MTNRQEQLAELEVQAKERFLNLESAVDIKNFLKENGAYQRDVDRIYREVKRDVQKSYVEEVEGQLLEGVPVEQIREQLTGKLRPEVLESVISSASQFVKRKIQSEVHEMVDNGNTWEEVVERYSGLPLIRESDLANWADSRYAQNQDAEANKEKKGKGLVLGIVVLLLGGGLSLESYISASNNGGTYTIWYGLIIGGVVLIGQGLLAQRD